jgi:cell division protein ZipA
MEKENKIMTIFIIIFVSAVVLIASLMYLKRQQINKATLLKPPAQKEPQLGAHYSASSNNTATHLDEYVVEVKRSVAPVQTEKLERENAVEEIQRPLKRNRELDDSQEVFVLRLLARKEKPYAGYELLQAILAAGLRFGEMSIFHKHEKASGRGAILFSLASAISPGTFELSKMGAFSSSALTLFLQVSKQKEVRVSLDSMLDTAQQIVDDLGGTLCDEKGQLLTAEKAQAWRIKAITHDQGQFMGDLFDEVTH